MERLKVLLRPPYYEDTELRRNAQITHVVLLTLILASAITGPLVALGGKWQSSLVLLAGGCLVLIGFALNRRDQVQRAAFLVVLVILVVISSLLLVGNGSHDIVMVLYPVPLILASLLLNRRDFLIITTLTILSVGVIIVLEVNHLINTPFRELTDYLDLVVVSVILIITAVALRLLGDSLNDSLARALANEAALAETNQRLQVQTEERARSIQRFQAQQAALTELALFEGIVAGDLQSTFQQLTEVLAQVLEVERTSIWLLDNERQVLRCQDLYRQSNGCHTADLYLPVRSYPVYFQTMQSSHVLDVKDTGQDPRVEELRPAYLEPLKITSMLDVVIRMRGELVGVVCSEHTGKQREWHEDEISFVAAVADQMTVALLNHERNEAEEAIRRLNMELERRVAERTTELETKARELETFAYSVSHDLKAPLRGIDGYSRLLLEDYGDRLDEDGQNFLHTIRSATERMNQLINDLLDYSRLERRNVVITPLSLPALVQLILDERENEIKERGVQVEVDLPCDIIQAEPEGLSQSLRNLLDNALKFTRSVEKSRIQIGGSLEGDDCVLWVKDNGIGFDMQYHDRIFEIFQRLHRSEDYPGTGVGLALVRKAMQRIGGYAWAESEAGKGSVFYLRIPKCESDIA